MKRYTSLRGKRTGSQDQKGVKGYSIRACSSQYPGREEKEKQDVDKKFGYRVGEAETAHKPKPCVKPVSSCLLPVFLLTLPPSLGASPSLIFSFTFSLPFLFHSKCLTPTTMSPWLPFSLSTPLLQLLFPLFPLNICPTDSSSLTAFFFSSLPFSSLWCSYFYFLILPLSLFFLSFLLLLFLTHKYFF